MYANGTYPAFQGEVVDYSEDNMTTITVDDALIKNARAVTGLKSDTAIVEEALLGFILDMKTQTEAKQYFGKLKWDPEFAGTALDSENER